MEEVRQRIIEAAYDEFAQRGPRQASLATIARCAETEEASIRALFVDQRGLLTAVLDEKTGPLVSAVSVLLTEGDDLRRQLPAALGLVHQFLIDEPRFGRVVAWTAVDGDDLLGSVFARSFFPSDFHDRLNSAVACGQLCARSAIAAVMILDSLLLFPQFVRRSLGDVLPGEVRLEELYDDYFTSVVQLLETGFFTDPQPMD